MVAFLSSCSSGPESASPLALLETPLPRRADAGLVFEPGEELDFDVAFGPFVVGRLTYRTMAAEIDGRPAHRFEGESRAFGMFAAFSKASGTTRVLVDCASLRPHSSFWTTAEPVDPLSRAASFDSAKGEARTASWRTDAIRTRTRRGASFFDPVSAMMFLRALQPPPEGEERRLLSVEGVELHLLTVRAVGPEEITLVPGGDTFAATKLSVRGDRLTDEGALADATPLNDFFIWIEDAPRRRPLRLQGRIAFGGVSITLRTAPPTPPETR